MLAVPRKIAARDCIAPAPCRCLTTLARGARVSSAAHHTRPLRRDREDDSTIRCQVGEPLSSTARITCATPGTLRRHRRARRVRPLDHHARTRLWRAARRAPRGCSPRRPPAPRSRAAHGDGMARNPGASFRIEEPAVAQRVAVRVARARRVQHDRACPPAPRWRSGAHARRTVHRRRPDCGSPRAPS